MQKNDFCGTIYTQHHHLYLVRRFIILGLTRLHSSVNIRPESQRNKITKFNARSPQEQLDIIKSASEERLHRERTTPKETQDKAAIQRLKRRLSTLKKLRDLAEAGILHKLTFIDGWYGKKSPQDSDVNVSEFQELVAILKSGKKTKELTFTPDSAITISPSLYSSTDTDSKIQDTLLKSTLSRTFGLSAIGVITGYSSWTPSSRLSNLFKKHHKSCIYKDEVFPHPHSSSSSTDIHKTKFTIPFAVNSDWAESQQNERKWTWLQLMATLNNAAWSLDRVTDISTSTTESVTGLLFGSVLTGISCCRNFRQYRSSIKKSVRLRDSTLDGNIKSIAKKFIDERTKKLHIEASLDLFITLFGVLSFIPGAQAATFPAIILLAASKLIYKAYCFIGKAHKDAEKKEFIKHLTADKNILEEVKNVFKTNDTVKIKERPNTSKIKPRCCQKSTYAEKRLTQDQLDSLLRKEPIHLTEAQIQHLQSSLLIKLSQHRRIYLTQKQIQKLKRESKLQLTLEQIKKVKIDQEMVILQRLLKALRSAKDGPLTYRDLLHK